MRHNRAAAEPRLVVPGGGDDPVRLAEALSGVVG
jgi:hypothetical protein